ncbi:MAG: cation:proton antiporter [Bryobacterales bacterium]|nr:cation:proton antiporter [Bryobacterales bacterium]
MDSWDLLTRVIILLGVAAGLGVLLRRLGQNAVVGYLLAGVLLGPTGFGLIGSGQQLRQVSELGVALLLFSIGLEFSFSRLRQIGRVAVLGGTAQIMVTLLAVAGILLAAGTGLNESLVVAAAISMSSTAVVLRVLMDNAQLDSRHGRTAVGILLAQDVAVVPLLLASDALAENLGGPRALSLFGLKALGILVAGGLLWLVMRYLAPALFARAMLSGIRELPVLVAACASLGAAAGAHAVGISPAVGAFAAGVVLAESPFATQMRADVAPLTAVFVAIFFAAVGTIVNLPDAGQMAWVLLAAAGILVLKTLLAAAVVWPFLGSARVALAAGLTLSQVGEFTFVLADNGNRRGLISASDLEFLVAVSLVTLVATPYVIGIAPRLTAFLLRRVPARARRGLEPPALEKRWERVIVVGYGPAGQQVVDTLVRNGAAFLVLEFNPNTVAAYSSTLPIELGDATQPEILQHAGVGQCRAVVITIPDPAASRVIIGQVADLAPDVPVIVRARYHQYAPVLEEAGAAFTVDEEQIVGAEMARQLLRQLAVTGVKQ